MELPPVEKRKFIEDWAKTEELSVGFASPEADLKKEYFEKWLAEGKQGTMAWMANEKRTDVKKVLPACESIIVLGLNYYQNPPERQGRIATYALGSDYHNVFLKKLKKLCTLMRPWGGVQKPYVDTGPVLEKRFAAATTLGWQGKNTLLISPTQGTWLFLGVILSTHALPVDRPTPDRCGKCTRCMVACPTAAIVAPYQLDARRCIAYLTIEHKGIIPEEYETAIGDRLFGCDDCLTACPWNRFAQQTRETKLSPRAYPSALEILSLTKEKFDENFQGTPIKRLGLEGLQRNACVVLGNLKDKAAFSALKKFSTGENEILKEHANRALKKIEA